MNYPQNSNLNHNNNRIRKNNLHNKRRKHENHTNMDIGRNDRSTMKRKLSSVHVNQDADSTKRLRQTKSDDSDKKVKTITERSPFPPDYQCMTNFLRNPTEEGSQECMEKFHLLSKDACSVRQFEVLLAICLSGHRWMDFSKLPEWFCTFNKTILTAHSIFPKNTLQFTAGFISNFISFNCLTGDVEKVHQWFLSVRDQCITSLRMVRPILNGYLSINRIDDAFQWFDSVYHTCDRITWEQIDYASMFKVVKDKEFISRLWTMYQRHYDTVTISTDSMEDISYWPFDKTICTIENGKCSNCSHNLRLKMLQTSHRIHLLDCFASKMVNRSGQSLRLEFEKFLSNVQYDVVLDGANVGLFDNKGHLHINLNQIDSVLSTLRNENRQPLVILHESFLRNAPSLRSWAIHNGCYIVPSGYHDDWFTLYAALHKPECLFVSNDEWKDHLHYLQQTYNMEQVFNTWKLQSQCHLTETKTIQYPSEYSITIQSENGRIHVPIQRDGLVQWCCSKTLD